ncbi:MAG: Gfo/Idh/MocA family oxidoreductase [Chloroflexaceae bacterium]|jgi:predicted dehydrogenase|nr:Gfo/Idh/MocA family oxidoreductase [Chloroflexaceae bacterium]
MTTTVRIGIIGAGLAGNWHANMFSATGQAKVVAAADVNLERATDLVQKHGAGHAFTDYRTMIETGGLDAVSIATSNDMHHPAALAALAAGLHVFCEKPLALTLAQAEEMTAAAHRAGVVHGVHFIHRTRPYAALAQRLVAGGHLGELTHIRAEYLQDWLLNPATQMPLSAKLWRTSKATAGSGVLGDLGAHLLDMLRAFQVDVTAVSARLRVVEALHPGQATAETTDDHATLLLECANGALVQLTASRVSVGHSNHIQLLVQGSQGALQVDNERLNEVQVCAGPLALERRTWYTLAAEERDKLPSPVESFVQAIAHGTPASPNFDDGLWVQRVLDAAERSAATGERVVVTG